MQLTRIAPVVRVMVLMAAVLRAGVAPSYAQDASAPAPEIVARVGAQRITHADVDRRWASDDPGGYRRLQADLFASRRRALDALVGETLLAAAAARSGRTPADLIAGEAAARARPVTDRDVTAFLAENPLPAGVPVEQGRVMVLALLRRRAEDRAREAYLRELRTSASVDVRLAEPRVTLARAAHSPVRGPADAPVELVLFSDFECPFCRRADPVLEQVMTRFAGRIRLVVRHYPLSIHPGAKPAAEAAQCAQAQGGFWLFRDRLLAGGATSASAGADLRTVARDAGLDLARFDACLASGTPGRDVADDLRAGDAAGVSGTPTVFINGIAVVGAQPFEVYERVVLDELRLGGVDHGTQDESHTAAH